MILWGEVAAPFVTILAVNKTAKMVKNWQNMNVCILDLFYYELFVLECGQHRIGTVYNINLDSALVISLLFSDLRHGSKGQPSLPKGQPSPVTKFLNWPNICFFGKFLLASGMLGYICFAAGFFMNISCTVR